MIVVVRQPVSLSGLLSTQQAHRGLLDSYISVRGHYYSYFYNASPKYFNITFDRAGTFKGAVIPLFIPGGRSNDEQLTIELQEYDGSSWQTRSTGHFDMREYAYTDRFSGWVDVEFDTEVAVTTDVNKWRYKVTFSSSTPGARIYWMRFKNATNTEMHVPYGTELEVYNPTTDVLFNLSQIHIDTDVDVAGVDVRSDSWGLGATTRRIAWLTGIPKKVEPDTQWYMNAGDGKISLKLGGVWGVANNDVESIRVGTEANPLTHNGDRDNTGGDELEITFTNYSASWQGGFMYMSDHDYYAPGGRVNFFGQRIPSLDKIFVPLAEDAHNTDTVKVQGDITDWWRVGDEISTWFGRAYESFSYYDYRYSREKRKITAISYDASTDVTTITLDSNIIRRYNNNRPYITWSYPDIERPHLINLTTRLTNIVIQANGDESYVTSSYNHGMRWSLYNLINSTWQGVTLKWNTDAKFTTSRRSYTPPEMWGPVEIRHGAIKNSRIGLYLTSVDDYRVDDIWNVANVYSHWAAVYLVRSKNYLVRRLWNVMAGSYGMAIAATRNGRVTECEFTGYCGIYFNGTSSGIEVDHNRYYNVLVGHSILGGVNTTFHDNYYGLVANDTRVHSDSSSYAAGLIYIAPNGSFSGDMHDEHADFALTVIKPNENSGGDVYVSNVTVDAGLVNEGVTVGNLDTRLTWGPNTFFRIENLNGDGQIRVYTENGKIVSEQDSQGGYQWALHPASDDSVMEYILRVPVAQSGVPFSVMVNLKIEHEEYWQGMHSMPILELRGLGIDDPSAVAQAVQTTDWQTLVVAGTPDEAGVAEVVIKTQTDSDEDLSGVAIDNVVLGYREPIALGSLDVVYRGLPLEPPINQITTPYDMWAFQLNQTNGIGGSTGEALERAAASGTTPADVWSYTDRTLTGPVDVDKVHGTPVNGPDDLKADVSSLATEVQVQAVANAVSVQSADISIIKSVETGSWAIIGDGGGYAVQVFYDESGTELFRAALYKKDGTRWSYSDIDDSDVVERRRQ